MIVPSFEVSNPGPGGGGAGGVALQPRGVSIVLGTAAHSTGAHEIGHSLCLDHCDAEQVGNQWTLMGPGNEDPGCPAIGSHSLDHFGHIEWQSVKRLYDQQLFSSAKFLSQNWVKDLWPS